MRDSRSSEGRTQEDLDIMAAASTIRVPKAPAAIGDLPSYSTNGTLNWSHGVEPIREPNLVEDKPLPGQGNTLCNDFQWELGHRASLLDIVGTCSVFYIRYVKPEKL